MTRSRPMTDTTPRTPIECVPHCVPECVPNDLRAPASECVPPSPSPSEGDTLSEPAALCPTTVSPDPQKAART